MKARSQPRRSQKEDRIMLPGLGRRGLSGILLIMIVMPGVVHSQHGPDKIQVIEAITVTAPGSQEEIKDVVATVEVINAQEIEVTSKRSLAQVIEQAANVVVKDTGSTSEVSIRGFSSGQVLILVDGKRRTGKYGSAQLNAIPIENIERIEIVRGPLSALYGADAMAGAINIVTRKATSERSFSGSLMGGKAENGDRETGVARFSGNLGTIGYMQHRLSAELKNRGAYKESDSQPYTDLGKEKRYALGYNGVLDISETQSLVFSAGYEKEDDEGISSSVQLNYPSTFEKEENYHLDADFRQKTSFGSFSIAGVMSMTDAEVNRTGGVEETDYDLYEANGILTYDVIQNHKVILGVGSRKEKISINPLLKESPERDVLHLFAQDSWRITPLFSVAGGLRYDNFSDFGDTWNPRISLSATPSDFKFRVGYGEAFKAPSFIEQYGYFERAAGPRRHKIYGNKKLRPEEAKTFEAGAAYYAGKFDVELVYHYSDVKNLIQSTVVKTEGKTVISEYQNVGEAEISGLEAILNFPLNEHVKFNASWAYLEKEDAQSGDRLTGYARNTIKAGIRLTFDPFSIYTSYRHYLDYYNNDWSLPMTAAPVDSDFWLFDIKVSVDFLKYHRFAFGVDNVFDKRTPNNYNRGATPNDPGDRFFYVEYSLDF